MTIRTGDSPCPVSKKDRPCIFKHLKSVPMGEGEVKQIWGCRRCGAKTYDTIHNDDVECVLSPSTLHQWEVVKQLSFQQHYRYREITNLESCSCCGAVREYAYQSMVGYSPTNA